MSYGMSAPLQAAVYTQLQADAALEALVGDDIFDAMPSGAVPSIYVSLGPEFVTEASDVEDGGAWHEFTISVVTDVAGFQSAKEAAGAVSDALDGAALTLSRGRLVGLWFRKAKAKRESNGARRIDMTFRARVEDDAA
ncbi:DUF3168 domain-containing protein [Tropicibacter sp. S64]|uniref:DUF3168 domain-containing protein n=1 Tax=Tropicibacter sp. S64 TaxID=3415122 RepID=UPI003C7D5AE2